MDLPSWFPDVAVILFGLCVGSFLNVCIYRLPRRKSVVRPPSKCPSCKNVIRHWENIPLLSYLLLGGRCSNCKAPISWVYPFVEAFTAFSVYLLYLKYGLTSALAVNALFFCMLIVLIFIDLFERILPDVITLGGSLVAFLLAPLQSPEFFGEGPLWSSWLGSALGALFGGGILWLVARVYLAVKKIEGMGLGDVKMMMLVGAFLGWQLAWLTIFLGSVVGAVVGSLYIFARRKGRRYELPFGTFLGLGAMVATLWGRAWLEWYFG